MPKFNLKLSKTLISNFAYVYSERGKLDIFILFQKFQFGYRNKVNPSPNRPFARWRHFTTTTRILLGFLSYLNLKAPVKFQ